MNNEMESYERYTSFYKFGFSNEAKTNQGQLNERKVTLKKKFFATTAYLQFKCRKFQGESIGSQ